MQNSRKVSRYEDIVFSAKISIIKYKNIAFRAQVLETMSRMWNQFNGPVKGYVDYNDIISSFQSYQDPSKGENRTEQKSKSIE